VVAHLLAFPIRMMLIRKQRSTRKAKYRAVCRAESLAEFLEGFLAV
jgi:hypothetical protein